VQAPIASTLNAFISLLLSPPTSATHAAGNNAELPLINLLVQLTPLVEQGRQKCHPYFPKEVGQTWELPSAEVEGESVWVRLDEKVAGDGIRTSKLTVGKGGDEQGRKVVHIEYRGWGDHGELCFPFSNLPAEC
jgi:protein-tyrosine phosphatase